MMQRRMNSRSNAHAISLATDLILHFLFFSALFLNLIRQIISQKEKVLFENVILAAKGKLVHDQM